MHFFGDLTGAVCLLDDYVWRTTQYHYRGQNREHREDDQTKPVINKNEIIISNIWNTSIETLYCILQVSQTNILQFYVFLL